VRYGRRGNGGVLMIAIALLAASASSHSTTTHTAAAHPTAGRTTTSANARLGQQMAAAYGWTGSQWSCLNWLWTRESGWSATARNPSSGAFGIAQALGHGTPGTAGTYGNEYGANYGLTTAQAQAANSGSAAAEIKWGLEYVREVYGSPCRGWSHELADSWY
jgi:hypothetical protein